MKLDYSIGTGFNLLSFLADMESAGLLLYKTSPEAVANGHIEKTMNTLTVHLYEIDTPDKGLMKAVGDLNDYVPTIATAVSNNDII